MRGMNAIATPDELYNEAVKLRMRGGRGFLLSGGCDPKGRVPISRYVDMVAKIGDELKLQINVHTGLLDRWEAAGLARAKASCYSVDVHGSREVIRARMHLDAPPSAFLETVKNLLDAGIENVVPHVLIGLDDDLEDAHEAVRGLAQMPVKQIVLLGFLPAPSTKMAKRPAATDPEMLQVVREAVSTGKRVLLGCMRPRGRSALEQACITFGVRDLSMPSRETIEWARHQGYDVAVLPQCCALQL